MNQKHSEKALNTSYLTDIEIEGLWNTALIFYDPRPTFTYLCADVSIFGKYLPLGEDL